MNRSFKLLPIVLLIVFSSKLENSYSQIGSIQFSINRNFFSDNAFSTPVTKHKTNTLAGESSLSFPILNNVNIGIYRDFNKRFLFRAGLNFQNIQTTLKYKQDLNSYSNSFTRTLSLYKLGVNYTPIEFNYKNWHYTIGANFVRFFGFKSGMRKSKTKGNGIFESQPELLELSGGYAPFPFDLELESMVQYKFYKFKKSNLSMFFKSNYAINGGQTITIRHPDPDSTLIELNEFFNSISLGISITNY